MEITEKEKILEQLQEMVRDKDEIIRKKDSELQEAKASLSKFKLQSKAKITKLNHQLEEAKKASIPDNASDKSSECGEELPTEQANRAKMKLLRRKIEEKDRLLAEKDEQLAGRDQQVAAKENVIEERNQVIQQREEMIRTITNQLHERDKIINDMGQSEKQPSGEQIDQIYAQILYKDKLIVDLNNKILELDRKLIDLQEFAGEKNEVVKGRDKVIKVLQTSIVEKDQNVTSQAALIKNLTSKVEASEENMSLLTEKLEKAEHSLKVESERFHLRLHETQKYFEETLGERESEISQLRDIIREREKDVATRDNNLRDLLIRHEQDLQEIMSRGEGSMQDHVVKMLEQKLRDINGVLDSKVQVIEVLTNDVADKDRQLLDTGNTVKALKEKLAVSSEQNLLQQQTFADLEMQWKEERSKLEMRLRASAEKLEEESGELNLQLHTLQMSLRQYEAAYSQAAVQYNALQERYQQTYLEVQALKDVSSAAGTSADPSLPSTDHSDLLKQLESETAQRRKLEEQVNLQEKEISRLQKVHTSESFSEKNVSGEKSRGSKQRQSPEKSAVSTKSESKAGDKQKSATDSPGSKANEAKLLKVKAQYTAKIKTLEKEIEALKKSGGGPVSPDVEMLQNRLAEVEEEKGNLMLHLVDFDDTRALQGQLEKQLSDMQKQNQSLQDETLHLQQQLKEAHLETSHLLERISQMQQTDEHIRAQYADEKAALLAGEEAQKMQMKFQLDQLQEECNRLTNQLQEDAKQQDSLNKQLQSTESCIGELRAQVQASNAAVEELQKNLVERSEQTSKLAGEKVGLEVRAAELEEIRDKLEQEKSELLTKVESLQNRIEFEKQPNLAFEKESQNLQLKIQELTEEISKEKGLSKVHKDQINELLPKLQQLENEKWQMEAERNQLEEQLMALSKAKEETDTLLQETKLVLESLRTDKQQREESVNKILQETDEEKKELQKKLTNTCNTMEQQTQEIAHICKALELEDISVQQLSTAVQNRISSIAILQTKLEKAEKELAGAQEVNAKQEATVESLKSQVKNYKKQIETSMQNMAEECDTYKENLLTKDQTIQLLQETVESQNNEMQKFHELQKARDQILTSLELKMEEYESNTLEKDKEHNAMVRTLQNEVETLQKELDLKTQEMCEMGSKQTLLSKDLESKDTELQDLKMQHASKIGETDQLLTKMDNERKAMKCELQEKTAAMTKQLAENEDRTKELLAKMSQLQDENSAKYAKIESLSSSLSEFSDKYNELSTLHNSAKTEKEGLIQQLQEYQALEETVQGLLTEQQLEMLTSESKEMQQPQLLMHSYIAHISAQLKELNTVKSKTETSLLESNKQNEILKSKIQDLEVLCSEKDFQLLNMKSDSSQHEMMVQGLVEERDQKISSLHQELDSKNTLLEETRALEAQTQSQLTSSQEKLSMKDAELSNVSSQLEKARQFQTGIEDELKTLREQLLSKETAHATLQASVAEQQQKVSCQSQQTEILQAELDTTSKELFKIKQEREEMIENLAVSQKHTEDLQKSLTLENEKTIMTETQLQDVQNQLTTVQAKLETANNTLHQLQTGSPVLEEELSLFKTQLDKREEQLQNLSSELADLLRTSDEQQVKLAKKDEKMMSLLENMQELEEQLTSLGNQREADIAKLNTELAEKTASLEEAEKSLQTKETQYLKVLATAKKLKQQGEAAKKEASQALIQLKELQDKLSAESSTSALDQAAVRHPSQDPAQKDVLTTEDMDNKSSERLQELTMQVESFSEYCQQLQLQVQTLTEKLHTAEQLAHTKQMQLEALQSISDEKESLATSQNELLEGFEVKLASLRDEKETLANVVVGKEEMVQTMRNRVEELDKKIKSLETETEKDARIRLLNEQLDETSKTMHSLQEEISLREEKFQESKSAELRAKNEYQKAIEQMTEQLKKAEEIGKAKQEISEQLASQMFDLSEQLQAKSVRVEELSYQLQSSDEKIKLLEFQLAKSESSLDEFKQQLQTVRDESEILVEELKNLKDLYNANQEQLLTQQKDLESKEQELLNVQKELNSLKDSLPKEEILQEYKQQLENQKTIETIPETSAQINPNVSEPTSASYEKMLDQTIIEFPEPDFSSMYESLKLEFDLVFSEKERLSFENLELKNSLTDVQQKEEEGLLKQQTYEVRIQQLEEGLQVSKSNMTTLEDSLELVNEQLSRSEEEKKHLLGEKEKLTVQIAELLENKKVDDNLVAQEATVEADKVPFVEKIEQEFQGPLHQVKIEREAVQRSAVGSAEGMEELEHMKELYEKLSDEHTRLKNKQQVAEVKCEKMLIKLKAFKEKNENLLRELSELKDSQNKTMEGIASQNVDLETEKQKHQETRNLLLAEQTNVAKERAKIAKMETVFRNKFQEVLDEKNHLSDSCNQLKTKCKELGARLKELLAERQDLQDSIDRLTSESETVLEGVRNEFAVEKSSLQSKISSLETECNNAYADIEDFQKLVSKMKESHEVLMGENQKLKNSAHLLESELDSSRSVEEKISQLELEVQGLQEERKSLQDQVEVAREEALAKMKELQVARKKQGDAEGKTKLQEEQINQLKELNETLQNAKWALEANLQTSQHRAERAEQEKKTLSDEVAILQQAMTDNEVLKGELALVESEAERKEQSVALFKHEVEALNEQVQSLTSQCRDLESTRQAITVLKKENGSLTEDVIRLNAENAELRSSKEELGVVSDRYNNLLQDNTALAKQIEELLTKLQKQGQLEKDLSFAHEQQGHLEREQATFIQRIEELEEQSQQLTNQNTQLKQEMVQVNSALKQVQFENESLKSQVQVMQSGGDRLSRFQEEYERLQQQFAQSVEQNNQVQAELNHSTHRLQLREARCQQLAMQVSQLAEDRSYLNIQMGNLSLALREKEKEASNLSSQCKTWYEKHCQLQQKVTELETSRAEALKLSNSQTLTNEIETLKENIHGLEAHQEELTKLNLEQASQFTSEREQRLLAETNLVQLQEQIKILQQQQLQSAQDFQIQIDEDQDRMLEAQTLLSRHGSSYIHRLQRWIMVKKEYLCFSSRQLSRLMRLQPRARTLIRIYFLLLHVAIVAFIMGLL